VALSRPKQGFDSPWERQCFQSFRRFSDAVPAGFFKFSSSHLASELVVAMGFMSEEIDDDDDDDEAEDPTLSLEQALVWAATRNTELTQRVSAALDPGQWEASADIGRLALSLGVNLSAAWTALQRAASVCEVKLMGRPWEIPSDYVPGDHTPRLGQRESISPEEVSGLSLVLGSRLSLRPKQLKVLPQWWFEVVVDLRDLKDTFPHLDETKSLNQGEPKQRRKQAPVSEECKAALLELFGPDGPRNMTWDAITGAVVTHVRKRRNKFEASYKTVQRAAYEIWPNMKKRNE
jgi:hypothetical protein